MSSTLSTLFLLLLACPLLSQVTNISGVVNTYQRVVSFDSCTNSAMVGSASGFTPGDRVLIIQMKGATIDTANSITFGAITGYGTAGRYEFGTIDSVVGQRIRLVNQLMFTYDVAGVVQIIRVPRYTNAVVNGTLTALPWNGSTGGVLAIEVTGVLTLNSDIDLSGRGFRGGALNAFTYSGFGCLDYAYTLASGRGGAKGEGVVEAPITASAGRGALANGGGGGNGHNAGGGGGANTSAGGTGGDEYSMGGTLGGFGGNPLNTLGGARAYMGGGGGAGHSNDAEGTAGSNGGGIIVIRANTVVGNGRSIRANGNDVTVQSGDDGAGGGGAGGTILLDIPTYTGALNLQATGGRGGDVGVLNCHGPGGSGSGGLIHSSIPALPAGVNLILDSGVTGRVLPPAVCGSYGATAGERGVLLWGLRLNESTTPTSSPDAGADTAVCAGESVRLSASGGTSYRWSPSSGLDNPLSSTPVATPDSTTLYRVLITTANGCQFTGEILVRVKPLPSPVISPSGPMSFCQGDSVTLTASAGFRSYLWSTGERTRSISVNVSGQYSVSVVDSAGCTGTSSEVTVVVNLLPNPTITMDGAADLCTGETRILMAPPGYLSYRWSTGDTTSSIEVETEGEYSLRVSDSNGCSGESQSVSVRVHPLPVVRVQVMGPRILCAGDNVTLAAPAGFTSYRWSTGSTSRSISTKKEGSYWFEAVNDYGCIGISDTVQVTVLSPVVPSIVANGPTGFCQGDSVELEAPAAYLGYRWSNGARTQTISVSTSGVYSVTVNDSNGCEGISNSITVNVNPIPVVTIIPSGSLELCQGDSVTLNASSNFALYTWSSGEATRSITIHKSGRYHLSVVDSNGCRAVSSPVDVIVHGLPQPPEIVANGTTRLCEGEAVKLDAPVGLTSYRWSNGAISRSIRVDSAGDYSVTVTDSNGCSATSLPQHVDVYPLPDPEITGRPVICLDDAGIYTVQLQPGIEYSWWLEGVPGKFHVFEDGNSISAQWSKTGEAVVAVTVYDAETGCEMTTRKLVSIIEPPIARIIGDNHFCEADSVLLDAGEGFTSYQWSTGDSTQKIYVHEKGTISVEVENQGGCRSVARHTIEAPYDSPKPDISIYAPTMRYGDTVKLDAGIDQMTLYFWYRNDSILINAEGRTIYVLEGGRYSVEVIDSNGCMGIAEVEFDLPKHVVTSISLPVVSGDPGDTIDLPLRLDHARYFDSTEERGFTATVRFNKNLLAPVDPDAPGVLDEESHTLELKGVYRGGEGILTNLRMVAGLGDSASTPLVLESFKWDDDEIEVIRRDGHFVLTGFCREGGSRFFRASARFRLEQNRPNPAGGTTTIDFGIHEEGGVRLELLDLSGKRIEMLIERTLSPGSYSVEFDAGDLRSGLYLLQLETATGRLTRVMQVVK